MPADFTGSARAWCARNMGLSAPMCDRIGGRGSAEAAASDDAGGCTLLRQTRRRYGCAKKSPTEAGQLSVGCAHVERSSSLSQPASIVYAGTKVWMPEIMATRTMAAIRQ
jgi:hypothetical protein